MKSSIFFVAFCLIHLPIFGQQVIQESAKLTSEQKRIYQIEEKIRTLGDKYYKGYKQLDNIYFKYRPLEVVLNQTQEKLEQKILNIEQTLYEIQVLNLRETCDEINNLNRSIGKNSNYCPSLDGRIKRLNEALSKIKGQLNDLKSGKNKATAEKESERKLTLSFGSTKPSDEKGKKVSTDDFWNGKAEKSQTKNESSNKDFWNGKSEKVSDTEKDEDFWNGKEKEEIINDGNKINNSKHNNVEENKIELEIYYENKRYGLKNIKTNEIVVPAIYQKIEFMKDFEYYVAYKPQIGEFRVSTSLNKKHGVLLSKQGIVLLEGFDYATIDWNKKNNKSLLKLMICININY